MHKFLRHVMNTIDSMDMQDWAMVLFAIIIVGLVCMRGYGSRSNY